MNKNISFIMSVTTDYSLAISAPMALMRGTHINNLIDISTDYQSVLPMTRQFFQLQVTNTNFNGTGQSPTITIDRSRGFKINRILLTWNLPVQTARNSWDQMAYDSLPGINCINSIEVIVGSTQFETLSASQIISRFFNYYGPEMFIHYAKTWWGGIKTDTMCTPLQQMRGIQSGPFNLSDPAQNVILPGVHIVLPAPLSFLFNKEKFCFVLAKETGIEFKLMFHPSSSFISRNQDAVLTQNGDIVNVFIEAINPCEVANFWNNLPYVNQGTSDTSPPYFFKDQYIEVQSKTFMANQAFQMPLKYSVMRRLETQLWESRWNNSLVFFGDSVQNATANWLASMFFVNTLNHNPNSTIDLSSGMFMNDSKQYSNLTIESHTSNTLVLAWQKTQGVKYYLTITCDTPFSSLGTWYFDLNTYQNLMPCNLVCPQLFMIESFNLNVVPWRAPADNDISTYADSKSLDSNSQILAKGYYTLGYDKQTNLNNYGFFEVNKIVLSSKISKQTWSYLISCNVPGNNNANILVSKRFPIIVRNQYQFWDLDASIPITVQSLIWEKNGSNTESISNDILSFSRNIDVLPDFFRNPLEIEYSLIDPVNKIDSYGFLDLRDSNYVNYTVTCTQVPLVFDNITLGEIWKDKINNSIEITMYSMQTSMRMMSYTKDSQLIIVTDFTNINNHLITDHLIPEDYFNPNIVLSTGQQTNRSVNMASLKSLVNSRRRALADGSGAAYTKNPEESYMNSVMKKQKFF